MNTNGEKLLKAMAKVKEGKASFVKNVSACEVDRNNVKLYRLKGGEELLVDKELDTHILDSITANKNIEVETVCSGHDEGPTVGFNYKGKLPTRDIENALRSIPNADVTYERQILKVAVPPKKEFKIEMDGEEYTLLNIKEIRQNYFFIKGTRKGNKTWWNNISNTLSKLK